MIVCWKEGIYMIKSVAIIIPVLNPDSNLYSYILRLANSGYTKIIVVDDGSGPEFKERFDQIKKIEEVDFLRHDINLGKGRAIKDALAYYELLPDKNDFFGVITVDADGQHTIGDVNRLAALMVNHPKALSLGERDFDQEKVPFRSKFGNSCTRNLFKILYHIGLKDTQTGLRGIPNRLIPDFRKLAGDRYEYEMNMLIACSQQRIPIKSITIDTIYVDNNSSSHFHPILDSFKIYKLLLGQFFKYSAVSILSFLVDLLLYSVLAAGLEASVTAYIMVATIGARAVSSFLNYFLNHRFVFKSTEKMGQTIWKYYLLAALIALTSGGVVTVIYRVIPKVHTTIIKAVVDTLLFMVSYQVQKIFIFKKIISKETTGEPERCKG